MTDDKHRSVKDAEDSTPPLVTPHDRLFRATFREARVAAGLLMPLLPAELANQIEWNSLTLEPSSYIDEQLRWKHADLLFSVRCQGRPALVYVLAEHQASAESLMALRLLGYLTKLLQDYVKRHPEARRLPPVVTLVVSNAPRPWSAPVEMLDLFELPDAGSEEDAVRRALVPHLPSFRYIVDDLSATTEEAIQKRALSASGTLALLALRHIRQMSVFAEALTRWRDLLQQLTLEQLEQLLTYILELGDDTPQELANVLRSHVTEESSEVAMSTADRLRQEGRLEGREEGRLESEARVRHSLLLLMRKQFHEVPPAAQARIDAASMDDLVQWLGQVARASTVADVFAENN